MAYVKRGSHVVCTASFEISTNRRFAFICVSDAAVNRCGYNMQDAVSMQCFVEAVEAVMSFKDKKVFTKSCRCNDQPSVSCCVVFPTSGCKFMLDALKAVHNGIKRCDVILRGVITGSPGPDFCFDLEDETSCSLMEEMSYEVLRNWRIGHNLMMIIPAHTILKNLPDGVFVRNKSCDWIRHSGGTMRLQEFLQSKNNELPQSDFEPEKGSWKKPSNFLEHIVASRSCLQWRILCGFQFERLNNILPLVNIAHQVHIVSNFPLNLIRSDSNRCTSQPCVAFKELNDEEMRNMDFYFEYGWYAKALASACKIAHFLQQSGCEVVDSDWLYFFKIENDVDEHVIGVQMDQARESLLSPPALMAL